MAMFLKRALTLVLVVCTLMALAVPAFAASTESASVSKLKVDTSGGQYYVVKSDNTPVRPKTSVISLPDFLLKAGSLVKVSGTSGSYYKVDMNGTTRYIKKTDVKKVLGKPMVATEQELELNPRARSAKLRVIEKL